jgi:hypothetical protein
MRGAARADDALRRSPPEPGHMPGGDVVRVQQRLVSHPPPEDRVAGVPRVVEDGPHSAALPAVRGAMTVLVSPSRRWARHAFAIEHPGDRPVAVARHVLGEDPPHDLGRRLVDLQDAQPVPLRRLPRVRVRAAVDHDVAVRRSPTLVSALIDDLGVHRRTHASLDVLALGLAHPAQHAHEHLVRRVPRVESPAQLRHPQLDSVRGKSRRDQRELVAEPAARPLPHDHARPGPPRVLQRREQPSSLTASLPRHRP